MASISDFPGFVINQIVGNSNTSHVAVKIWLCGDKALNNKLSKGLTFLELKCHPLSKSTIPQMVTQLRSLRHLSLQSTAPLLHHLDDWPAMMRSFPNTLESLAIRSYHDHHHCTKTMESRASSSSPKPTVTYSRGESTHIELETLFPHLHTLILASGVNDDHENIDADLFAALPASLTRLEAPILVTTANAHYFSKLPPSLTHLSGPLFWSSNGDFDFDEELLMTLRSAMANVPSTLQTLKIEQGEPLIIDNGSHSYDCWLPKSLLEIYWACVNCPSWLPSVARTMPSKLHTLTLGNICDEPFVTEGTNWLAELPRTLTKLTIQPVHFHHPAVDFASHIRSLPPNLTELTMFPSREHPDFGMYGNWSAISGADFWPSNLTTLGLRGFSIAPSDVTNLPKTLTKLELTVDSEDASEEEQVKPMLDTSKLPPNLTWLDLGWTPEVEICISLSSLKLTVCILVFYGDTNFVFPSSQLESLPDSLTGLHLVHIVYVTTAQLPSSLNHLFLSDAHCDILNKLPRELQELAVGTLDGLDESPLVADGQLFKDLPLTLTNLRLHDNEAITPDDFELPAQELSHLPSMTNLSLTFAPKISSRMLRQLPRSLKTLEINITEFDEDDLLYLPAKLETCIVPEVSPSLASRMPLRSLARLFEAEDVSEEVMEIAKQRVLEASKSQ